MFWGLAPILVLLASLAIWSNHFEATFQDADSHVVLNNRAIQNLRNVPHFFTTPLLYANQPELAEYRPLALVSLALDYWIAQPLSAAVFQADSFAWFLMGTLLLGVVCLTLPDVSRRFVVGTVALFLLHPLAGETVNYVSRRGDLIGAACLLAGLAFRIVWPSHLPDEILPWDKNRVPKTGWDDFRRRWAPRINARYRAFVEAPLGLYMIPVVVGMLADPGVAVFPLLLLTYIVLFDRVPAAGDRSTSKKKAVKTWRRVLPSAVVCGGFWIAQSIWTWKYAAGYRLPTVPYVITQPWVILRSLFAFVAPIHLTPESDLQPFAHFWDPLALAGFAGLAALIWLAGRLGSRERWKTVAFGLWWFLIAFLPYLLIPRREVEADYRMYLPLMGLAIATAAAGWALYASRRSPARRWLPIVASGLAALLLLGCSAVTFQRNKVWGSESSFWEDATEKSPRNGRAFIEYGAVLSANSQEDRGYAQLEHAVTLISSAPSAFNAAPDEIRLALAFDRLNKDSAALEHFQRALKADPEYASAWSAYARWLMAHQRASEAFTAATRAVKLSPWNVEAQHVLLEYYSANSDWPNLQSLAAAVLKLDPTDSDGRRSAAVAEAGFQAVKNAEEKAKNDPSLDDFLALSVQYYRARRFEDSVKATQQALKLQPDLVEAYSNMAAAYYALGKYDDAIRALREAIRIKPDFNLAKGNLEFLLRQQAERQSQPVAAH